MRTNADDMMGTMRDGDGLQPAQIDEKPEENEDGEKDE